MQTSLTFQELPALSARDLKQSSLEIKRPCGVVAVRPEPYVCA